MAETLVPNPDPRIAFAVPDGNVADFYPLKRPKAPDDTFEIGLVLGGTVSAAAYTAGVLDFLVEALDAWTLAKSEGENFAPNHNTVIKIAAGTSGGGISCVLLARTIGSAFPPCRTGTTSQVLTLNPFYDTWVNQIDITDLLQVSDLNDGAQLASLLCAHKLDLVCDQLAAYQGKPLGTYGTPHSRAYIEQLLPVVLTLTNLRGIPYSADFRGTSGRPEYFVDHADHMRFRIDVQGNAPPTQKSLKPYEIGISDTPADGVDPWSRIIHAARGTSAFPVGLPPQAISRDPHHYQYRYVIIDDDQAGQRVEWLRPAWSYMIPKGAESTTPYQFLCVDGGCFNNEPIKYAHDWIAGILGKNDQEGDKAHRAIVLVDPFADPPGLGLISDPGVLGTAGGTLSAWTSGTRFQTADLDLFTAEDVFSRFLVNPVRNDDHGVTLTGGAAIATSCLGAFGGFFKLGLPRTRLLPGKAQLPAVSEDRLCARSKQQPV